MVDVLCVGVKGVVVGCNFWGYGDIMKVVFVYKMVIYDGVVFVDVFVVVGV